MALHPINDRTFLFSAAAGQIGETNLYSMVKAVLGVTGSLSLIDNPATGTLTLSNGSGAALSSTTAVATANGVGGGGLLSAGLTLEMDIPSLTTENTPDGADLVSFYDVSAAAHRRTAMSNLPFLTNAGGTLTGPLEFADGSVGAPSFAWASDPTSGMFWNGTGFELVVGGATVATVDASGLTVQGTMTTVNTNDLIVSDNTITLNDGEAGAGVTAGSAGVSIDRGTSPNANLIWDEATDCWMAGVAGSEGKIKIVSATSSFDVAFPLTNLARRVWQNLHTETITAANAGLWSLSGYGNVDTVNDDSAFRIQVNGVDVARATGGDYAHGSDPNGSSSASVAAITLAAGDVVTFDFINNGNATDGVTGRASGVLH